MSLVSVKIKTEGECPSDLARVGLEYECDTDANKGQTLIMPDQSNCTPLAVIKQDPEDIFALKNTKQPRRSTTQGLITNATEINDNKYEDITDVIALQLSVKQELSNFAPVVSDYNAVQQDAEDNSGGRNTEQPHLTESNQNSINVDSDSVGEKDSTKIKRTRLTTKRKSNENRSYKCKLCDKSFKINSDFTRHEVSHAENKLFQCPLCQKTLKRNKTLHEHMKAHSNGKSFSCYLCEKYFSNKNNLFKHLVVHSDDRPFQCKQCEKSFKRKISLTNHEQTHSVSDRFHCHLCDKSFKSEETLNFHAQYHSIVKRYSCDMCEKSFQFKKKLREHLAVHSENRPFQCKHCDKSFKIKRTLKAHYLCHSEFRPFNCEKCGKSFKRKCDLFSHISSVHKFLQNTSLLAVKIQNEDETQLNITHETIVGIEFDDITDAIEGQSSQGQEPSNWSSMNAIKQEPEDILAYKNHEQLRTHETEDISSYENIKLTATLNKGRLNSRYSCDQCRKLFRCQNHLLQHQAVHDQPFQCKQCEKTFKRKRELIRHELTHSDARPFQCLLCQNKFSSKKTLHNHTAAHSSDKPYPCDLCEKSFKNKTHLFQHQTVHSHARPFQCKQCEKNFKSKRELTRHERTHSKILPEVHYS